MDEINDNRVTIVMRDAALLEFLEYILGREGFKTEGFLTSSSFRRGVPDVGDVVIVDTDVRPLGGFSVIRKIREVHPKTVIFCLTHKGREEDRLKGLSLGANDYIVKPFSPRELLARMRATLEWRDTLEVPGRQGGFYVTMDASDKIFVMAGRIENVADGIAAMRLNSAADYVQELRVLGESLRAIAKISTDQTTPAPISNDQVQTESRRAATVLTGVYDIIGSERGAQAIAAGGIAGVVSLGGWPAAVVYGLTLAAWAGKDALVEALKSLGSKQ